MVRQPAAVILDRLRATHKPPGVTAARRAELVPRCLRGANRDERGVASPRTGRERPTCQLTEIFAQAHASQGIGAGRSRLQTGVA